jgi:hypothetical protein
MPPQRSSQTCSNPRAGGRRERRESPREEWGARRPHARLRRAEETRPWCGWELLLWRAGRLRTCGGLAATASGSAQGDGAGGGAGPPNIADCNATAVTSVRCQGKEVKEGILAVIIFHNRIVALFTTSITRLL